MRDSLCKFCGQVYDVDRFGICPQCGMRSGHLVCQECGAVFNPLMTKGHKCPACGTMPPEGWKDDGNFLLKDTSKENPGKVFPGVDEKDEDF